MSNTLRVGIIMGSDSDWPTMKAAADVLDELGIAHEARVVSAHRMPHDMAEYAEQAAGNGITVVIAGAGGAAHLPGMVASMTDLPVIGVPVPLAHLEGLDSLLSIVQMPGGVPVDSGPTVFTMRWVFDQIMASVGTRLESQLSIHPLNVLARHFWEDGSQLDLFADPTQSLDAVARWAGPAEAKRFAHFCQTAREVYDALEGPFIKSASPTMAHMMSTLGPRGLATLASVGPMRSLWHSLGRHFQDPRLRQLFARYATYCGSSPWEAPATLMLIAQVEMDGEIGRASCRERV